MVGENRGQAGTVEQQQAQINRNIHDCTQDHVTAIYGILREKFTSAGDAPIFISELKEAVSKKGFNDAQFKETLDFYMDVSIFDYSDDTKEALVANAPMDVD